MKLETISESTELSFADTPFPIVAEKLAEAGVACYEADLIALRKTFYDDRADHWDQPLPLADAPDIPSGFDTAAVEASWAYAPAAASSSHGRHVIVILFIWMVSPEILARP